MNSGSTAKEISKGESDSDEGTGTDRERESSQGWTPSQTSPEEDLVKLREALNVKLLQQNRLRGGHSINAAVSGVKRVSPIKEETPSPPVGAGSDQFHAPYGSTRTTSTVSTESTESQRTVRGTAYSGGDGALRTPSYPFPYVPGTPRSWSGGFQPFTMLSPTSAGIPRNDLETPGRSSSGIMSSVDTPAGDPVFAPPGDNRQILENPRFPTPNLYELTLQLNAEPGLEQWWATVTNLVHDHFKAERATLIMPTDSTDIESSPWGQKATFNMNGPEEFVSHSIVEAQTAQAKAQGLHRPTFQGREQSVESFAELGLHQAQTQSPRPKLEARHSYAGHGQRTHDHTREVKEVLSTLNESQGVPKRPQGLRRHLTHAAGMTGEPTLPRVQSSQPPLTPFNPRHTSLSDPDFSSVAGGVDAGPFADVFPNLHALERENRPLIEASGVHRVLQRGRVVTVIRDYATDSSDSSTRQSTPAATVAAKQEKLFGNYRTMFSPDHPSALKRDYEEYEQHPTSPWAQSPAPSPAIQTDEERNPFFTSEEQQVEDSFNPAISPKDYSQLPRLEAIGVDNASTVIHIPLVHPTISQPMQSLRMTPQPRSQPGNLRRSNTIDLQRMAPIAILSILSPVVPYPHNLIHALRLLGPHLATSFSVAQQFSAIRGQTVKIRQRLPAPDETFISAPMTVELASIEDVIHSGFRTNSDLISDTLTSPSEYSGRSKNSPGGSMSGTPGWDPASHGWTPSRSVPSTPAVAHSERSGDYFEAKNRQKSGQTGSASHSASARSSKRASQGDAKGVSAASSDEATTSRGERKTRLSQGAKEEKTSTSAAARERSPPHQPEPSAPIKSERPPMAHLPELTQHRHHSLLHSYGADFQSSFGALPTATSSGTGHSRKGSYSEDMPPPSERLLRLIIDSVPVQIFTAQPETGQLSWVNAKLLNYRGQDARKVLSEPWAAIHPDERDDFLSVWHRSLRTNQQMSQKVRLQNKEGNYRWFFVRCLPLKNPQQRVVHWIGTMMDFHEQHMAEINYARQQETEASQAKYKALANSSPQVVFSAQRAKGITFCNTQWLHYSGQTEKETLGQGFLDHVHPDDLDKCRFPIFEDGSSQPTNVPTSLPIEPKRSRSASALSSSGSSETEKAVAGSELPTSPASSTPQTMTQRKLAELASTGILKVTRDADGRPSYSTEVRLKSKDNEFRWHLVRVLLAEPSSEGESEGTWYGTCTDINDHKTLERDLKETMDEKSRFLSNMSHEIRTPLNGITGMVNFLMDTKLTPEQMEHVNIIRTSTEGLRGLINDILDLSKAEAGMITLIMDWLYPRALIEEVNDLTSTMAIEKGLELNYLVDEDVPAVIKGDKFRIRQILLNTVGNAIKFTQKGEVFVRCSLERDDEGELKPNETFLNFEIIDTGRGFTDQEAEFLFKRFSQIDGSSTRQHGGTGLGLVISRQLAQLHGGDMGATGVPNKGSTFTFYIKAGLASEEDQVPLKTPGGSLLAEELKGIPTASKSLPAPSKAFQSNPSLEYRPTLSPKFAADVTESPAPYPNPALDVRKDSSPSLSSGSSDPSVRSAARSGSGSARSTRSSASSLMPDASSAASMKLSLPSDAKRSLTSPDEPSTSSNTSDDTVRPEQSLSPGVMSPPMFSILVIAPLKYSREATVHHIGKTLPKNVPHQITARESYAESRDLLGGMEPVTFSHVVVVLHDVDEIIALMSQVFSKGSSTSIILISDLSQRKQIVEQAPQFDFVKLEKERKLVFIFKPLKPSRLGLIFDPQKEREMSLDRNQDSAQQVASNQKAVFEELKARLGNKDKRVLLVEDNKVNQMVLLKYLAKSSIQVDTVLDGVQCTDKVFASRPGHYSIILCDLHMPNKDGYQTCKEVRRWEKKNNYAPTPIIALSANVLGDVYQKCVDAGFNDYMTKPVDFKELSMVLLKFMDPADPTRPHETMRMKRAATTTTGPRALK